jgi:uncharacterized membrane protein
MTPTTKQLLNMALATLVYAVTSALVVNLVDPISVLYSHEWWKHLGIAIAGTTVIMEAKFWRTWAAKILGIGDVENNGNDTSTNQKN